MIYDAFGQRYGWTPAEVDAMPFALVLELMYGMTVEAETQRERERDARR